MDQKKTNQSAAESTEKARRSWGSGNPNDPLLLNEALAKVQALQEEEDRDKHTVILETEGHPPGTAPKNAIEVTRIVS